MNKLGSLIRIQQRQNAEYEQKLHQLVGATDVDEDVILAHWRQTPYSFRSYYESVTAGGVMFRELLELAKNNEMSETN